MDAEKQKQLIEAGKFRENNGSVMRVLNILDHTFHELKDIEYALPNLSRGEIVESINYLNEEGYIHLRSIADKEQTTLADANFEELEAKAASKGLRLLRYVITDPCIRL